MIFMTAMALGVAAGLTRSVASVTMIAVLIVVGFAAATSISASSFSLLPLFVAVGGYNAGMLALMAAILVFQPATARLRARRN